ncbi:MAG: glycosyltransferase [Anaerolineae bacterium]
MSGFWLQHQVSILVFLAVLLCIATSNLLSLRSLGSYALPRRFPRLSVLIPARNEAATIACCVRSLLAQDYPDFEIIVLDDNSGDGTRRVLKKLGSGGGKLRVLAGAALPLGWLGKLWACQQLLAAAEGELLLFTDADTCHDPQTLRQAVAALFADGADLLTVLPEEQALSWGEKLALPLIHWSVISFLPLWLAQRLQAPALSVTIGQFMLVRRSALEQIGAFTSIRQQVLDDMALGRAVKAQGLRWRLVDSGGHVSCRMYAGLRECFEGFGKNLFAIFGYRIVPYVLIWTWLGTVFLEPPVVLVLTGVGIRLPWLSPTLSELAVVEALLLWGLLVLRFRLPLPLLLVYPVAAALHICIAMYSLVLNLSGRALWKGRRLQKQRLRWI